MVTLPAHRGTAGDNLPATVEEVRQETGRERTQEAVIEINTARKALGRAVRLPSQHHPEQSAQQSGPLTPPSPACSLRTAPLIPSLPASHQVKAAEELFESTAPKSPKAGGRMWDSRIDLAFGAPPRPRRIPLQRVPAPLPPRRVLPSRTPG